MLVVALRVPAAACSVMSRRVKGPVISRLMAMYQFSGFWFPALWFSVFWSGWGVGVIRLGVISRARASGVK